MHSIESLREIRSLEHMLGILPGTPSCETYPTMYMAPKELHEAYPGQNQKPTSTEGVPIARIFYNLKTHELRIESLTVPAADSKIPE